MDDGRLYRFSWWRALSFGGAGLLLFLVMWMGGAWWDFVYIPALILVGGLGFLLCLGTFGLDFVRFIPAALRVLAFEPLRPNGRYAEIARFASRCVVGCAAIATMIGVMQMVRNLASPDDIGMAMMIAMVPSLYALLVSELFLAVVYRAYAPKDESGGGKTLPVVNAVLPLAVALLTVLLFFVATYGFPVVQRA